MYRRFESYRPSHFFISTRPGQRARASSVMTAHIALIKGDGIGGDICDATLYLVNLALRQVGAAALSVTPIDAGAAYFQDTGLDI